jgi:transposase
MQLTDFAREVPDEVWTLFAPILPPVVWWGNGCPPDDNRECLHAVLYVLVTGSGWQMLPKGVPSYKTVHRRLKVWLHQDAFRRAWQHLAPRYETWHGINGDEVLLEGSKKPAKKGASRPAPARWSGLSVGPHCIERAMPARGRWGWS